MELNNRKLSKITLNKKGQLNISFGMIFSIILIIAFLGFAFYAIQKFLAFQHDVTVAKFYESLDIDVDQVWKSTQASKEVEYIVPRSVKKICFKPGTLENVYFYEEHPIPGKYVEHLDIGSLLCINTSKGKVNFLLEKQYGEALVKVSEA